LSFLGSSYIAASEFTGGFIGIRTLAGAFAGVISSDYKPEVSSCGPEVSSYGLVIKK